MTKQVYLAPETISTAEKQIGFPADTSFWQPLWMKFSARATMMEIHCWAVENEVRTQLGAQMKEVGKVQGTETIAFQAGLSKDINEWMATQSYDIHGGLKWFSIFLVDAQGNQLASIEHYGGEITFYAKDDLEIEEVKSFFRGELIVHVFDE